MNDRFTVTTRQSWLSRLGASVKAIGFGLLLFIVAFPLLWWNEGRAVITAKALTEGAASVVSIPADRVDPRYEGRLIHTTGRAITADILTDPDFPQVQVNALGLQRHVEMYQWRENQQTTETQNVGGSVERETTYSYTHEWSSNVIDSSRFYRPAGHQNPATMPYSSLQLTAASVTVGAFNLPTNLVQQLSASETLRVPDEPLPEAEADQTVTNPATPQVVNGQFYIGHNPTTPQVGDVRIRYSYTPEQDVSIIAQQQGNTFVGHRSSDDRRTLLIINSGIQSADAMFTAAQTANQKLTWLVRLGGFLLMVVGLKMLLGPLGVIGDVIPFIGRLIRLGTGLIAFTISAASALTVIAMAWIVYRPLLGTTLLAIAVVIFGATAIMGRKKAASDPGSAPAV
jgi:hypothetical protein